MSPWIARNRNYIDFTLASMLRRKGKNVSIVFVYTLVVFVLSSVIFFSNAIRKEAQAVLAESPEMLVQRVVAGRHDLIPVALAQEMSEIRGVGAVQPRLWGYYYHAAARANYTIMAEPDFKHGDDKIVVGNGVLASWGSVTPEGLYFKAFDGKVMILKVADSFSAKTNLVTSDIILTSENTFRRLFGIPPGVATDLALSIRNEAESQVIAEKIDARWPDTRTISRQDIARTYAAIFDWRSGYVIVILSMSILSFFIFAWDKATGLSAEERREIGILKALGWDTSDVLLLKFWESASISLISFLVGVILAYAHVYFANASLFEHALKGWGPFYPSFTLKPTLDPYQLASLFFLTVVPYSLITIIPTWGAAVADPDAVMRQV